MEDRPSQRISSVDVDSAVVRREVGNRQAGLPTLWTRGRPVPSGRAKAIGVGGRGGIRVGGRGPSVVVVASVGRRSFQQSFKFLLGGKKEGIVETGHKM